MGPAGAGHVLVFRRGDQAGDSSEEQSRSVGLGPGPGARMLAKRIIPCLDVNAGRVVKGTNFINLRDAGDPVAVPGAPTAPAAGSGRSVSAPGGSRPGWWRSPGHARSSGSGPARSA